MNTHWDTLLVAMAGTIEKHDLLSPQQSVLAAVSGGADSMALLHGLHALGYPVRVLHIDHCTREGASAEDAAFVEDAARTLGVPCTIKVWNDKGNASGDSFEMAARKYRYQCYVETAHAVEAAAIATGHHADDQIETLLMRILRGTSLQGLTGIPYQRRAEDVQVIRPLLDCSRQDIQEALTEKGIAWREDETNSDAQFQRNKIRQVLLPYLRENYNANVDEALLRLSDNVGDDTALLERLADDAYGQSIHEGKGLQRDAFRELPVSLQRRVVLKWTRYLGVNLDKTRIDNLVRFIDTGKTGTLFLLSDNVQLIADVNRIQVLEAKTGREVHGVELPPYVSTVFQHQRYFVSSEPYEMDIELDIFCTPQRQVFDADKIVGTLMLRNRIVGDTFTPLGMAGTRKLKDVLMDKQIPVQDRDELPLLCDAADILWIVGHQSAGNAAVDENTKVIVVVEVQHETE